MSLRKLAQKVLLITFLAMPSVSLAQIKMEGPKQIEAGELARINIDGIKGLNDPKIECFPKNDSWEAVQRLDGSPVIIFYTKKEGIYTFIVAGNKENKTYFVIFQIQVGKAVPVPDVPTPGPGKYTQRLRSLYLVNPDEAGLTKLVSVYKSMAAQSAQITSYKQMNDALALATKGAIGDITLRGVRDEVALILQTDLANRNSMTYNATATSTIFLELAKSLSALLEGSK